MHTTAHIQVLARRKPRCRKPQAYSWMRTEVPVSSKPDASTKSSSIYFEKSTVGWSKYFNKTAMRQI